MDNNEIIEYNQSDLLYNDDPLYYELEGSNIDTDTTVVDNPTLEDLNKLNGLYIDDQEKTLEEIETREFQKHSFIPTALSAAAKKLSYFSFKDYLDSDVGGFYDITKTNIFLENNKDYISEGLGFIDSTVDIAIVCLYSEDKNSVGISSSIFEAFEIYQMIKINSLPYDLGGPKIRLIFTDYLVSDEGFVTKTNLGPNRNYGNEILKAIFIKYDGTKALLEEMQRDIIFLNRPKEIRIKKSQLPYQDQNYKPSNILIVDGPTDKNNETLKRIQLEADNLHLPLSDQKGFSIELFNTKEDINFFCLYIDERIRPYIYNIYRDSPRIFIFNDIKRINFWFFRYKDLEARDSRYNYDRQTIEKFKNGTLVPSENIDFTSRNLNYRRYLLYLTPNSRAIKKVKRSTETGEINETYPIELLDDIIDSLRSTDLNNIAKKLKEEKIELQKILRGFGEPKEPKVNNKDIIEAKKLYTNSEYTLDDILAEKISVHFVIVGLDESNIDFREALQHRALMRGINSTCEVYTFNTLPIENIHSKYDVYIYTPTLKDWDASPRFIPEAIYYNKKIYFTKLARKESSKNIALKLRIEDTEKHFGFINEDDLWYFPKMQLTRNLLGYWPTSEKYLK